jgi:hypothetical protein
MKRHRPHSRIRFLLNADDHFLQSVHFRFKLCDFHKFDLGVIAGIPDVPLLASGFASEATLHGWLPLGSVLFAPFLLTGYYQVRSAFSQVAKTEYRRRRISGQ